jgi:predicted negative regulator of RcsB-dependent stress response
MRIRNLHAQGLYEQALKILRQNKSADRTLTKQALQSYGELLNQMNQKEAANKIYAEAQRLSLKY